jgi:hypothetical protein
VLEQAAKTHAKKREPFQSFFRDIRRTWPRREGRTKELAMAEKRHCNLRGSGIALHLKDFLRSGLADDRFPNELRLGKRFYRDGGQDFTWRTPSWKPRGFQDSPRREIGSAAAANTTHTEGFAHRPAEETKQLNLAQAARFRSQTSQ